MPEITPPYDPSTMKLCPKRCHKRLTEITTSYNGLINRITQSLSEKMTALEDRLTETVKPIQSQMQSRLETIDERISSLYRQIQSPLLAKYVDCIGRCETLFSSCDEMIQETESPTPSQPTPTPLVTPLKMPLAPSPESPTPSPGAKKPDCLEIDLCERVWAIMSQWQQANVYVNQSVAIKDDWPYTDDERIREEAKKRLQRVNDKASMYYDKGPEVEKFSVDNEREEQ